MLVLAVVPWWAWIVILWFAGAMLWQGLKQTWRESAVSSGQVDPIGFERQCAAKLRDQGWVAVTTPASGDQGVDVIARKGRVLLVLQCKLWSGPVGNSAVQEIHAGRTFNRATAAAVVSTSGYTESARRLASSASVALLSVADLNRADAIFRP